MADRDHEALLTLIEARRRDDVAAAVRDVCQASGLDAAVALLADVQAEVGVRWQRQDWTVADEHAASAIVDHALTVATLTVAADDAAPTVAVACVEDEWHVLPARMLAEQLRQRGWSPLFLGASAPAGEVGRYVRAAEPVAVALSCSMNLHLPGARRSIAACHDAGVPVVVGGGAFPGPARAQALGADAWSDSVDEVDATLRGWAAAVPPLATPTVAEPTLPRGRARAALLDRALTALAERVPLVAGADNHEATRRLDDLDAVLRSIEAALHVDDPAIVKAHAAWFASVSEARGEPAGLAALAVEALAGVLPEPLALPGELALEV